MTKSKYFYITIGIGLLFGFLPIVLMYAAHGFYPKVPLEIMDDTLYYYTRIREVLVHHYFIGNPYLLEYTHSVTSSFFFSDWVYALPFFILSFFKLPFVYSIVFSQVLWTVVTILFLYTLYSIMGIPDKYRPWVSTLSLLAVLFLVFRPVAMAVVYPVFLFFLISLFLWIKNSKGKKENVLLVLSSVLGIYVYTYLLYIVIVSLGFLFIYSLMKKENTQRMVCIFACISILSFPNILYIWKQLHTPFYFETLTRIGLVSTHTVGGVALLYSSIILVALFILYFIYKKHAEHSHEIIFFSIVFITLFVVGLSNVFSGKDLEVAVHVGRFTDLFVTIFLVYIFWVFYSSSSPKFSKKLFLPAGILFVYVAMLLHTTYTINTNVLKSPDKEAYLGPLSAIIQLSSKPVVVLANDDLSSYIPVLTNDYVLFHPNAELYVLSDKEVEERYLVSRMFSNLTKADIKVDFRKYAGVGNAVHGANVYNRKTKLCLLAQKILPLSCSDFVTPYSLVGEAYFDALTERYAYIKKNPQYFLDMYHVEYILVDLAHDTWAGVPQNFKKITIDSRFVLYQKI